MQNKLWILLRAQFLNKSGLNAFRHETDRKKKNRILGMGIAMGFVAVVMAGYSFGFAYGFGYLGMAEVVPGYAITISALVTLVFTFFKTNGFLFAYRDYDLLMALPVRTETVITAKFMYMYLSSLLFAGIVMLPMGIGYAVWSGVTVKAFCMWVVVTLFVPLFPMTIASAAGVVIAGIGSKFRHKVLVQTCLTVALIVAILGASFWVQGQATEDEAAFLRKVADIGVTLSNAMHKAYPLSSWFDDAINQGNFLSFVLLILVSVVFYGIFIGIVGRVYKKINTALMTYHAVSNYQIGELKTSTMMMALVKKEASRFFSSTLYLTNMGIGLIIALLFSIASVVVGFDKALSIMKINEVPGVQERLVYALPFAIAMFVNMSCTTAVSLSLEGKNLWVVESLPIERKKLLQSKMLFNLILVLPVSLICSVLFMIELKVSFVLILLYLAVSVTSVLLSTVWGSWINIHFPNFAWENEVEVIKQGLSSLLGIFSGLIGFLLMAVLAYFLSGIIAGEIVLLIMCILMGTAASVIYPHCK